MQVKKFEAPTIQEALDAIKRELGPEAIILQTKRHKKGFGLMNGASVEITAAVSERAIQKKSYLENRVPSDVNERIKSMPASQQARILDQAIEKRRPMAAPAAQKRPEAAAAVAQKRAMSGYGERYGAQEQLSHLPAEQAMNITQRRYIDIDPDNNPVTPETPAPRVSTGLGLTMEEELRELKRMLADIQITQNENAQAAPKQSSEAETFDDSRSSIKSRLK
ncbi:MAG: hypothetical protein EOP09_14560 [Proteobacteria bacterium]|nr:MAG: hypothetical protein EOP09_14560 [Pseudomonadota bacterium]